MNKMLKGMIMISFTCVVALASDISEYDTIWGDSCNSTSSYAVKIKNTSNRNLDVKVCLERTNGKWACFVSLDTHPGEIIPDNWGYYVCKGTGKSTWYWRDAGTYKRLPSPTDN